MATVSFSAFGASPVELPLCQFDADEFIAMAEAGIFENRKLVELVGGYVVDMSPAGPEHNYVTMRFPRIFAPLLNQFELWTQGTLRVDRRHVFDPDFMLLNPREQSYKEALPAPSDVALIAEISGTSVRKDAHVKLPIYAAAGVPEYWIANLDREVLVVHRQPADGAYQNIRELAADALVHPLAAPDFSVRVADIFR